MTSLLPCTHCAKTVPNITPTEDALQAVVRALANGSKTIAAAELRYFAQCSEDAATVWVDHLLSCIGAWPTGQADQKVLAHIDKVFAKIPKPEHFTDYKHCDECKEHDETLRSRNSKTLRRQDLGNAGWDPITFSSADGIGYYFPALARFALLPDVWKDHSWYGTQLLSHLSWEGESNRFLAWCSPDQREAVFSLLKHLASTRTSAIAQHELDAELNIALRAWQLPTSLRELSH